MSQRTPINDADNVPAAIGPYSQAMVGAGLVFLSGQIALDPASGEFRNDDFATEARQVFANVAALAQAAGGSLNEILKLNVYLTDMGNFAQFNEIATEFLNEPYPARAAVEVAGLPKGATVEIEAVMLALDS